MMREHGKENLDRAVEPDIVLASKRVVSLPRSDWRIDYPTEKTRMSIPSSSPMLPSREKRSSTLPSDEPSAKRSRVNAPLISSTADQSEPTPSSPLSTATGSNPALPPLSDEQREVFRQVVEEGRSIFFTGSAGTGKSVLLRAIISQLKKLYGSGVAVTASTGIAACNISGCTIHSFAAIGHGEEPTKILVERVMRNEQAIARWRQTRVLVIDEISMIDGALFDKIEAVASRARNSAEPFGGIQVVLTGDFFQLPPVNAFGYKYTFQATCWDRVVRTTVELKQVFRQKNPLFIKILNEMRLGRISEEAYSIFRSLKRECPSQPGIEPTELYPLRKQVDFSNLRRLDALPGEEKHFVAIDRGKKSRLEQCIAPQTIKLKVNAQVMLLKNMDNGKLANGSLGIVVGFVGEGKFANKEELRKRMLPHRVNNLDLVLKKSFPIVKFNNYDRELVMDYERWTWELPGGEEVATRLQVPLMLAWALTIHKSQGQTLDHVRVDLGQVFESGHAYVALSRATSFEGLQVLNFDPSRVKADPKVIQFYESFGDANTEIA